MNTSLQRQETETWGPTETGEREGRLPWPGSWGWRSGQPPAGLRERRPVGLQQPHPGAQSMERIHLWGPPLTSTRPRPRPGPLNAQAPKEPLPGLCPPPGPFSKQTPPARCPRRRVRGGAPRRENGLLSFPYLGVIHFVLGKLLEWALEAESPMSRERWQWTSVASQRSPPVTVPPGQRDGWVDP